MSGIALKSKSSSKPSRSQKGLWLLGIFFAIVLFQGSARPVWSETQEEKDAKKAAEQLKKDQEKIKKDEEKAKKEKEEIAKLIENKYDEFTGQRTLACKYLWVVHQDPFGLVTVEGDVAIRFQINYGKDSKGKIVPLDTLMTVRTFARRGKFEQDNAIAFSVDGNPYPLDVVPQYNMEMPSDYKRGGTLYEILSYKVSFADFKAVALGSVVKGRLGSDTKFEVKERNLGVLRELYNQVTLPALPAGDKASSK